MKILRIILICTISAAVLFGAFKVSKNIVKNMNSNYIEENPIVTKKPIENQTSTEDIDKLISHVVNGTKETTLPIKYEKNYTIYEKELYVTCNKGKTWLKVPEDNDLGYARVNEYVNTISQSNIYAVKNKVAVVYGGRGSENICIITTESQGEVWSVSSISKTATHDLEKGYDKLYIDFLEDGRNGYIAAAKDLGTAQEKILAYNSVNTGVTWQNVNKKDTLYKKIMERFGM
jgi:hypothetical protein